MWQSTHRTNNNSHSGSDQTAPTGTAPAGTTGISACYIDATTPPAGTPIFDAVAAAAGYTDNCGGAVTATLTNTAVTGNHCGWTLTYTFTVTDICGNQLTGQTIQHTGSDQTGPTADALSPLGPYSCFSQIPAPNINDVTGETDNCGGPVTVTHINDSGTAGCTSTITRTYRLTDQCGNTANITQTITINDTTPPTANPLPDLGPYACASLVPAPNINVLQNVSDNCGGIVTREHISDTPTPDCSGTITRTYRITDGCGNSADISQNILINDNIAPVLSGVPANAIVGCFNVPAAATITATDNCDPAPILAFTETSTQTSDGSCTDFNYTITRTWTATDRCGNSAIGTQIITIENNIAPTIQSPADITISCDESSDTSNTGIPTILNNCDPSPSITFSDNILAGLCLNNYIIRRTFTVTDACGNSATTLQTITVRDITPPTIICPPNITVATPDDIPLLDVSLVTATDNCGSASVSLLDQIYYGLDDVPGFCPTGIDYIFRAVDECGNTSTCTYSVTVTSRADCSPCQDDIVFFPVDLRGDPDSVAIYEKVRRDAYCCADPTILNPRCAAFNIILDDDAIGIAIEIDGRGIPPDSKEYRFDCDTLINGRDGYFCIPPGEFHTFTFCKQGNDPATFVFRSISGLITPAEITTRVGCSQEITVSGNVNPSTIRWTDPSGNGYERYLSCTQGCYTTQFTPDANSPETILYVVCGDLLEGAVCGGTGGIICDTVIVHVIPEIDILINEAEICEGENIILTATPEPIGTYNIYWYNNSDASGTLVSQDLGVSSSSYSPLNLPAGTYNYSVLAIEIATGVECAEDTINFEVIVHPLPIFTIDPIFAICTEDSILFDFPDSYTYSWSPSDHVYSRGDPTRFAVIPSTSGSITYTVTATTDFGCTYSQTFTLNVEPCLTCSTVTLCPDGSFSISTITEFIAAGGTLDFPCAVPDGNIQLISSVSDNSTCPETITNTYEVWDACGNRATCDFIIILTDDELPLLTCPANINEDACSAASLVALTGLALSTSGETEITLQQLIDAGGDASDNCNLIITYRDITAGTCPTNITRIFTVSDLCNNTVQCQQTIILNDDTPPSITCPPEITYEGCTIDDLAYSVFHTAL
jgi:hypothetical protein